MKRFKTKKNYFKKYLLIIIFILILFFILKNINLLNINNTLIKKYLFNKNYINIDINKYLNKSLNITPLSNKDSDNIENNKTDYFKDPNKLEITNPVVYIYNTHQLEEYSSEILNDYNVKPNVLMASYMLKEKLNKLNIPTIVEETNITEILRINSWKYSYSYKASRMLLENARSNYSSLKLFIDLHRDSSSKDKTTLNINGINYAKVLFICGLDNPYYENNLNVITNLNERIKKIDSSLSRGIYKKSGSGVNGVYNQDFDKYSILIEMGGQFNTIDEVDNTLNIISIIISEYVGDEFGKK